MTDLAGLLNRRPLLAILKRQASTGDKLGGAAQQNLPLAVIAAGQTKHTGDGTLRRQNNLSSEVI